MATVAASAAPVTAITRRWATLGVALDQLIQAHPTMPATNLSKARRGQVAGRTKVGGEGFGRPPVGAR